MTARGFALAALALLCAAAAGGCATVRISREGGKTIAGIENTGWYLFNFIPLASGDPVSPNSCRFDILRDTTTIENNMRLLDYAARKNGAASIGTLVSHTTDESVLVILLKRHACHTSAELIMPGED